MLRHRPTRLCRPATIGVIAAAGLLAAAVAEAGDPAPRRALFATREEAEAAAPQFHCRGAHRMGDRWMPCASHGETGGGHGGSPAPTGSSTR